MAGLDKEQEMIAVVGNKDTEVVLFPRNNKTVKWAVDRAGSSSSGVVIIMTKKIFDKGVTLLTFPKEVEEEEKEKKPNETNFNNNVGKENNKGVGVITKEQRKEEQQKKKNNTNEAKKIGQVLDTNVNGVVKWFDLKRGFGYVTRSDTNEDVFIHHLSIIHANPTKIGRSVGEGETIIFDVVMGVKGTQTANVAGLGGGPVQGSPFAADSLDHINNNGEGNSTRGVRGRSFHKTYNNKNNNNNNNNHGRSGSGRDRC